MPAEEDSQDDVKYSLPSFINFWSGGSTMSSAQLPAPPSTTSSDTNQFRVVRKRNRIPLSCAPCRHRKLKCNRGHPCDNCTKRGDVSGCTYVSPTTRKKQNLNPESIGTPDDMQNRIDRLESLVLSLMTTSGGSSTATAQAVIDNARNSSMDGSASAEVSMLQDGDSMIQDQAEESDDLQDVSQGIGIMKVDGPKTIFASDAHWYAILANIAEVKNYYAAHYQDYQAHIRRVEALQDDDAPGASFLFQAPRLTTREEVLAQFPSKAQADILIGRYFNSYDPSVHIIHGPTFQKQYDRHWQNVSQTPLPFIAIMYAMMSLALQSYDRAGDEPQEYIGRSLRMSVVFRRLTAQTIILADITQPVAQILEALVLHLQAEYGRSRDPEAGISLLVSLVVRIAMRMGYHRDAGPYANITPFQAEMRRRVWMMIRQCDLLFSAQTGLPSVSRSVSMDTKIPRNLYDDEIHEELLELPPSRPDDQPTPMSYMIAKARIADVYGRIIDSQNDLQSPMTYDEAMERHNELRLTRANLPPHLRLRPLRESFGEPANVIMQRYGLELFFLKCQCVLHRRFLSRGRDNSRYAYSRRACIDASMDMLTHQATLHHESQPGGRLHSVKWYISSLTTHDFLLAAMIICLELHHVAERSQSSRKSSAAGSPSSSDVVDERRSEMLEALRHSMTIWESLRDRSVEAWKASTTLRVMLEKLINPRKAQEQDSTAPGADMSLSSSSGGPPNGGVAPKLERGEEQAAAMTLGLLSSGGLSPNAPFGQGGSSQTSNGNGVSNAGDGRLFPASMSGLGGEIEPDQRTGLTPGYGMQDGAMHAPSPFTQMFGSQPALDMNSMVGTDIDWGAWDTFVQGSALDPSALWGGMVPEPVANAHIDPAIDPAMGAQASAAAGKAQAATALMGNNSNNANNLVS